ncbi:hypothetical protein KCP78_09480 [Salmonella enterica subsp. enterica]|nr:hypothetical protein KCP78_09480 [Salmonella enterica subsp. enterica]
MKAAEDIVARRVIRLQPAPAFAEPDRSGERRRRLVQQIPTFGALLL